jgi:hypothetical protein
VHGHPQRGDCEHDAEQDGCGDEIHGPYDVARQLQRPHAEVVHEGDAGSEHGATGDERPSPCTVDGDADSGRCQRDRGNEGEARQVDAVADFHDRLIGQHCDEMRRPDAAPGRSASGGDPRGADAPLGGVRPMQMNDGGQARHEAHDERERDKAGVMRGGEAG